MNDMELVRAIHEATVSEGTLISEIQEPPAGGIFAEEWKTFQREVQRLIGSGAKGRFALIKGTQVLSVWDTQADAIQAGRERLGDVPFLVQEIQFYLKPIRSGYMRQCPRN